MYVLLSTLIFILCFPVGIEAWRLIVETSGQKISYWKSFLVLGKSAVAKYLGSGIFQIGARIVMAKKELSVIKTANASIVELSVMLTSAIALAIPLGGMSMIPRRGIYLVILALIGSVALIVYPNAVPNTIGLLMSMVKKRRRETLPPVAPLKMAIIFAYYLLGWLIQIIAFFVFCLQFSPLGVHNFPGVSCCYLISFVIGCISPFAPGGLGVRDAILIGTLSTMMPLGSAAAISIGSRIWIIAIDSAYTALSFGIEAMVKQRLSTVGS